MGLSALFFAQIPSTLPTCRGQKGLAAAFMKAEAPADQSLSTVPAASVTPFPRDGGCA